MEKPEGVGGGGNDSANGGNVGRIVIPRFISQEDEIFEFCADQLFNGNYEQSKTALECLTEEDDQLSRHYINGFTEVVNKKKLEHNNQQQVMQSSSQESPSQTKPIHECTKKKLDNVANYQNYLKKKNLAKYQKVLKKARDFHKQRWKQMSEIKKNIFRKRILDAELKKYNKVTLEKKREKNQKTNQRIKNDEAQMERKRATRRRYYARLKATGSNQFECEFCGKSNFVEKCNLVIHEQSHFAIKPFACTWPSCRFSSKNRACVIRHVRRQHFHLPRTKKAQQLANIIDDRDANDYVRKDNEPGSRIKTL